MNDMKKYILCFLFFAFSVGAWAQTSSLKGKVMDAATSAPLSGATIQYGNQQGTVTDRNGEFSIECSGPIDIVISFIGYDPIKQNVKDCAAGLTVSLNPSNPILNAVEITASSELNRSMLSQPLSITKLGAIEMKRSTGLFLDDAINANVPGVFMQRRTVGAGQQFNIRGYGGGGPGVRGINSNFDGQGVKVYLNGIPITDAEGVTLLDDIDFASIGNVEIIKGPSGTLYGLAIAGVVNLQTMRPEKGKSSIGQDVLVGSYGLSRLTTRLQIDNERSSIMVNYGKQNFSGFMDHTNSTKDFVNMMGDFRLSDKQSLTSYFGWSNSYDARNGELTPQQYEAFDYSGNPAYVKNDAHSNIISFRAGIGHNYQFNKNWSNTTALFATGMSNNNSSAGGWTDKAPVNYGFRTTFDSRFELGNNLTLSGVTGMEAQQQYAQILAYPMITNNADPGGYNIIGAIRSNQTVKTGTYSIFTQWTLTMPKDLSLTLGVGSSHMGITLIDKFYVAANNTPTNTVPTTYATKYDNMLSPHISLNKVFNHHVSLYASYREGYKAPVASSIYTPLANAVNTSLRPEKGTQFEVGSKGTVLNDKLVYEVALFFARFSDKMTLVGVPNAAGTATLYSYVVNSGSYDNKGLEVLLKYTAYKSETGFLKSVRPFANAAYSDFKYNSFTFQNNISVPVADYSGNKVAGVAPITANAGVDFATNPGLYGNITYMFRDVMPYTPDGLNSATSYNLLNAKVGYRKAVGAHFDLDAYFGANNIGGVQYYQMVFVNQLPDAYLPGPKDVNYYGGVNVKYLF
jgi:iron complex outermembrane receptor protein